MSEKICTFCGQAEHRAHACPNRPAMPARMSAMLDDDARIDALQWVEWCEGRVSERVRAALLKKFDAYVPADVASGLRWRIAELEAQVSDLQVVDAEFEPGEPSDARILQIAYTLTAHPDAKTPTVRGEADLLEFARAVLAMREPSVDLAASTVKLPLYTSEADVFAKPHQPLPKRRSVEPASVKPAEPPHSGNGKMHKPTCLHPACWWPACGHSHADSPVGAVGVHEC